VTRWTPQVTTDGAWVVLVRRRGIGVNPQSVNRMGGYLNYIGTICLFMFGACLTGP
jgi:hypothetical protein